MTDMARQSGEAIAKPYVNAAGEITVAFQTAAVAIDTSWLQTQGALERANAATQELTYSTKGLSDSAIMLGHTITNLGEEVNAYGNAVAKTTDQTQALLNLQISSTERFATDVKGLLEQVAQTRKEYFNILGSGFATTSEKDYYLGVLGKKLKILQDLLAGLGYDESGGPSRRPPRRPPRPRQAGAGSRRPPAGGSTAARSRQASRTWSANAAPNSLCRARLAPSSRPGRTRRQGQRHLQPGHSHPGDRMRPRWRGIWCRTCARPI